MSASSASRELSRIDALELLQRQADVLEMIAQGQDLASTLAHIVLALEDLIPAARCSILLFQPATNTLHHGAAPSLPDEYIAHINGMSIGESAGSCGTAVATNVAVVVDDITTDSRWENFREFAKPHGLRACWSTPIRGRDGIAGTFAVYHDEPHTPNAREELLVERFTHLASVAIDHAHLLEAIAQQQEMEIARKVAESASKNKSEFVAAMSHDMRTPLQAISGFTEMLRTMDLPPERRQTALEHIADATEHITALVNDVLDIARIEAGSLPLKLVDVHLDHVMRSVQEITSPLALERGIAVSVTRTATSVQADERRLRQVLLNLVSNAITYNQPNGTVKIDVEPQYQNVAIAITNTGAGIPADKLDRLFVPFDRLGAEDSGEPGVGLGLSLALGLTEAMGGALTVDSQPGVGTTVVLSLPKVGP